MSLQSGAGNSKVYTPPVERSNEQGHPTHMAREVSHPSIQRRQGRCLPNLQTEAGSCIPYSLNEATFNRSNRPGRAGRLSCARCRTHKNHVKVRSRLKYAQSRNPARSIPMTNTGLVIRASMQVYPMFVVRDCRLPRGWLVSGPDNPYSSRHWRTSWARRKQSLQLKSGMLISTSWRRYLARLIPRKSSSIGIEALHLVYLMIDLRNSETAISTEIDLLMASINNLCHLPRTWNSVTHLPFLACRVLLYI